MLSTKHNMGEIDQNIDNKKNFYEDRKLSSSVSDF